MEGDRLARLYPRVIDRDTALPRSWSIKDKFSLISLSQRNLRVHYKGAGKNDKDAASVRATRPIPSACGLYYFEVTVVSKGRDGYIGVGLSVPGVNLNRLPGWEKNSFGYHADDGYSFNQSGTGQPYGPTFTTGDTVGCCVDLVDNTCFFTKNGVELGLAFTGLPAHLYPTVGLQTPGEVLDTNFGEFPFVYDFEGLLQEHHRRTLSAVELFTLPMSEGVWHSNMQRIVSDYLIHHGYHYTADAFARLTGQSLEEDYSSIRNRRKIQNLVLEGQIGQAIKITRKLHPGLLEQNPNLLFMLRCRLFIEMVAGVDEIVQDDEEGDMLIALSPRSMHPEITEAMETSATTTSSTVTTDVGDVERTHHPAASPNNHVIGNERKNSPKRSSKPSSPNRCSVSPSAEKLVKSPVHPMGGGGSAQSRTSSQSSMNGSGHSNGVGCEEENKEEAGVDDGDVGISNGVSLAGAGEKMEVEEGDPVTAMTSRHGQPARLEGTAFSSYSSRCDVSSDTPSTKLCTGRVSGLERLLRFGRELQLLNGELKREHGPCPTNEKLLQDAFSLLAYADPWSCPLGSVLLPKEREPVADALNSAILESHQLSRQPPLELAIQQTRRCLQLMSKSGIASGAFVSVEDFT